MRIVLLAHGEWIIRVHTFFRVRQSTQYVHDLLALVRHGVFQLRDACDPLHECVERAARGLDLLVLGGLHHVVDLEVLIPGERGGDLHPQRVEFFTYRFAASLTHGLVRTERGVFLLDNRLFDLTQDILVLLGRHAALTGLALRYCLSNLWRMLFKLLHRERDGSLALLSAIDEVLSGELRRGLTLGTHRLIHVVGEAHLFAGLGVFDLFEFSLSLDLHGGDFLNCLRRDVGCLLRLILDLKDLLLKCAFFAHLQAGSVLGVASVTGVLEGVEVVDILLKLARLFVY